MDDAATIISNHKTKGSLILKRFLYKTLHIYSFTLLTIPSPDTVMWLWERLIGFRGLLRAISAAVFGDCFTTSWSPDDSVLVRPRPSSPAPPISFGPSPFPYMTVSFSSTVAPIVRLVSVASSLSGYETLGEGWSEKLEG